MALYRKYRPASFAEVVGQEQVTRPLSVALDSGRINHAYLFSGPRGCGKTSSARILARSLNCVEGPTSTPCGVCPSCVSLAPGGPGNLDVTELDAASHNGVEDMRELRDRAFYAPAESRYRVFIIDEAHMITKEGSNALLKIVEEPPEHLIFIFATTEPEKVIGTIRSRTHHYPFRLLTPPDMRGLLQRTCKSEGVTVADAVFPLVIRAGGGSPRDSLSILDQLIAGSGPEGLSYEMAVPLLGVTDSSLIDSAISAVAAGDQAALFTTVDDVINAGHDPRRFAHDLLDRLRDLMVLQAVPDAISLGLVDVPADHQPILAEQAALFDARRLSSLAAMVNDQVDELRGATSPRLLLEIMCARMMLSLSAPAATSAPAPTDASAAPAEVGAAQGAAKWRAKREAAKAAASATTTVQPAAPTQPVQTAPPAEPAQPAAPEPTAPVAPVAPVAQPQPTADSSDVIRAKWQEIRKIVGQHNPVAEIMLTEAKVLGVRDGELLIGHNTGALAARLNAATNNAALTKALKTVTNLDLTVRVEVGTSPEAIGFAREPQRVTWKPEETKPAEEPEPEPAAAPASGWGTPAPLGGGEPEAVAVDKPAQKAPEPVAKPKPKWKEAAERGREAMKHSFSGGVPLPPEPDEADAEPEWAPPPVEAAPSPVPPAERAAVPAQVEQPEDSEEEEMIEAASGPANYDHRDAKTIAMDMLQSQLGARPL
ncbi:DNA polymerase III subunit gamma and tau [Corynebacterium sp. H127]|uniref:DNA polymerase III subunit gamma and tau n=1 Tax=Corynebacterium sp. H127 TaxID=3133418 RepID=UPI0030A51EF0